MKLEAAAGLYEAVGRQVDLGTIHNSLGRVYRAHGRLDVALAHQLKALAIHERSNSPHFHLQSLNAVAVTYQALGDSRRARTYLERALALAERDDGLLTAQEIYKLRLDADLAVLSACRSASGRVTGDGIGTFARAFIYAGARSIVASLWDVADQPTSRLLPEFYRAWLRGVSKAHALRTAQLRLLNDLRAGKVQIETPAGVVSLPEHPVFWAGFALFGEAD